MDSLVCDLTNALNSKPIFLKNKKNIKNRKNLINKDKKKSKLNRIDKDRRHQYDDIFSSSSSDTKKISARTNSSRIKHKKIMNFLLAAKASMRPNDHSTNSFDSSFQNLVRLKKPNSFSSTRSSQCQRQSRKTFKKSKRLNNTKVYKIQKIYRFHSNYRLHCLKLRRLQKKMLRSNVKKIPGLSQEKMSVEDTTHSSSASTITTSPSYSTSHTTTDLDSSSISDCYNEMDNLRINSDSDGQLKMRIKNKTASKKSKSTSSKRKLLSCRQRKHCNNSITSQSSLNLNSLSHKKFLNFKRKRCKPFMNKGIVNKFSSEGMKTEYEDSNNEEINIDSDVENCKNCQFHKQGFVGLGIKMNAKKIENEADDELSSESSLKKEFECIPWWNTCENEIGNSSSSSATLNTSLSQSTLSNYQRLDLFSNPEEKTHFDQIVNGALELMNQSSAQCYKNKIKFLDDEGKKSRKKRSSYENNENSFSTPDKLTISEPIIGSPISESNLGNKMLKKMGWQPGTSLGTIRAQADPMSLKEPIVVFKRPKRLGLGYNDHSYY